MPQRNKRPNLLRHHNVAHKFSNFIYNANNNFVTDHIDQNLLHISFPLCSLKKKIKSWALLNGWKQAGYKLLYDRNTFLTLIIV